MLLESGHPVYLPLYPGECNIPPEPDTTAQPQTTPYADEYAQDKQGGIGPFTKEQNFEKDTYLTEVVTEKQQTVPQKGLGPFTRDQNPRHREKGGFKPQDIFSNVKKVFGDAPPDSSQQATNPWAVAELTDGDSNSLENTEAESGRGFSESTSLHKSPTTTNSPRTFEPPTTEYFGEIREPVLKPFGKETGRSLKLPEITEPILRPRPIRQNEKNGMRRSSRGKQHSETIQEPTARGFTVQFLPERLAGILAHAERYARQTLLPLISQYTPSFVGGPRYNQPTYFPPLGDIANESLEDTESREIVNSERPLSSQEENESVSSFDGSSRTGKTFDPEESRNSSKDSSQESEERRSSQEVVALDIVPQTVTDTSQINSTPEGDENVTSLRENDTTDEEKINDWIPMVSSNEKPTEGVRDGERRFIPLLDFANPDEYFVSSTSETRVNDIALNLTSEDDGSVATTTTVVSPSSHIQKIPAKTDLKVADETKQKSSSPETVFPYIYERKNDPRTRYIPLLPEEDFRKTPLSLDRAR